MHPALGVMCHISEARNFMSVLFLPLLFFLPSSGQLSFEYRTGFALTQMIWAKIYLK